MRVIVNDLYQDREMAFEGDEATIKRELIVAFPWLKQNEEAPLGDLLEYLDSCQAFSVGGLEGDDAGQDGPIVKSEVNTDLVEDFLGGNEPFDKLLDAACFLASCHEPDPKRVRNARYEHGGDDEAIALVAVGLDPTGANRGALRAVLKTMGGNETLHKAETDLSKMALVYDHPTEPKVVYRVENKHGMGPYHAKNTPDCAGGDEEAYRAAVRGWAEDDEIESNQHASVVQPSPLVDFPSEESSLLTDIHRPKSPLVFGFESPEHAEAWFSRGSLQQLDKLGFKLRAVPAKKIYRSNSGKQVMFEPHPTYKPGGESINKAEKASQALRFKEAYAPLPEGRESEEAIRRAIQDEYLVPIELKGKHAKGILIARDEKHNQTYLLKPGAGRNSPAKGVRDDSASQSRRECAFYYASELMGLGQYIPKADLIVLDGKEYACLKLISWDHVNLEKKRKESTSAVQFIMIPHIEDGSLFRWSFLYYVLGEPDGHFNNCLVNPKGSIYLIDHGSAFAGRDFNPSKDRNSFIPFFLRVWAPNDFNKLSPKDKLKYMPRISHQTADDLKRWAQQIDSDKLASVLYEHGIDAAPSLMRLEEVKALAEEAPLDLVLNKLWVGV